MWFPKAVTSFIWLLAALEKTKEFIESGSAILDWEKDNEWATEKTNKTQKKSKWTQTTTQNNKKTKSNKNTTDQTNK